MMAMFRTCQVVSAANRKITIVCCFSSSSLWDINQHSVTNHRVKC